MNAQTSYQYPNPTTVIVQQDQNASGDGLLKSQTLYDGLGRAVESDTFESASQYIGTRTLYDALGRTQWVTNPARSGDAVNTTTYTYDSLGRVTQTQTPDGALAATVYAGNTVTVADQAGNKKQYTYNALGWLTNVLEDPSGLKIATAYLYDTLGNLKSVTQGSCPGQCKQRGFSYDSLSRLVSAANPESGTTTYSYNPNGTLAARTDANSKTTSYLYDGINRLTQKSYSDGTPTVNYFYDSNSSPNSLGRLSQVSNANGSTLYTRYDVLGRATTSTQVSQGHNYNFGYSYNLAGALLSETYPSGRTLWSGYDGAGRLAYVRGSNSVGVWTNYMIVAGFAAHGAPTSYVYGNNLWRNVTYNSRLQATSAIDQVNNNAGQQLLNLAWNWGTTNNNGNLQGITQNNGGPGYPQFLTFNQSFIYDSLNRLSTVSDSGGWSQAYQYDQWGNRWLDMGHTNGTPINGSTPTTNVFDGNNRMSGGAYDSAGNQTVVNGNTLVFDAENRMVSVTAPGNAGGGVETIQYDGSDHRISKTVAGTTTAYVYDVFGQLAVEYSTVPQPTPCATCYLSADQLGTPRLVTDGGANLIARHDYLPFGEEIGANTAGRSAQWGPANDNLNAKFTGQERDSETGLDYFNARYMGTSLGRFVGPDPGNAGARLNDPQSWNAYTYVGNNPLSATDPTGMSSCPISLDSVMDTLASGVAGASIVLGQMCASYDASRASGANPYQVESSGGGAVNTGSNLGSTSPELAGAEAAYASNFAWRASGLLYGKSYDSVFGSLDGYFSWRAGISSLPESKAYAAYMADCAHSSVACASDSVVTERDQGPTGNYSTAGTKLDANSTGGMILDPLYVLPLPANVKQFFHPGASWYNWSPVDTLHVARLGDSAVESHQDLFSPVYFAPLHFLFDVVPSYFVNKSPGKYVSVYICSAVGGCY